MPILLSESEICLQRDKTSSDPQFSMKLARFLAIFHIFVTGVHLFLENKEVKRKRNVGTKTRQNNQDNWIDVKQS